MNASWSMVFGALLAGLVGGFMIPVRPEIRDVPALTASKTTEPAKTAATDKPAAPAAAKTENTAEVRKVPLTETAPAETEPAARAQADGNCAKETWPYRSPNCLDRTATVAPADTVVPAKPVDPKVSLRETTNGTTTAAAPKPETAKPEPKTATAPPAREEQTANPPAPAEQAAARSTGEPRAQAANERQEAAPPAKQTRRTARRTNRNTVEFDDGIPTRIYLRGPDGRLYLAPETRSSGRQTFYFMR